MPPRKKPPVGSTPPESPPPVEINQGKPPAPKRRSPVNKDLLKEDERSLVEGVLGGKSIAEMGRQLEIAPSTAYQIMSREHVRAAVVARLNEVGGSMDVVVEKLVRGFDAEKFGITPAGEVVSLGLDHSNIVKYLDTTIKLHDAYPNPRMDVEHKVSGAIVLRIEDQMDDPFTEAVEGEYREVAGGG